MTKNSADFRGPAQTPGSKGEYRKVAVHAGLVCLNGPVGTDLGMQIDLMTAALEAIAEDAADVEIMIRRYGLPMG